MIKLYIVEDDKDLRDCLVSAFASRDVEIVAAVHNPADIKPEVGSVVLTDCNIAPYSPVFDFGPGVTVLKMSGRPDNNPDLHKPFRIDDAIELMKKRVA